MSRFKVGVFMKKGKRVKYIYWAYTIWFNPEWEGCREMEVEARTGAEAKKIAIEKVRAEMENGR